MCSAGSLRIKATGSPVKPETLFSVQKSHRLFCTLFLSYFFLFVLVLNEA